MRVLSFHYKLKNGQGELLDSSEDQEPFPVLEGMKQILPALEEQLFQMNVGDTKTICLEAAEAYGLVNDKLKLTVTRDKLPEGELEVGTQFKAGPQPQDPVFMVTQIEGDDVHLDGNHPLAGQDLEFDVEIAELRPATEEEKQHGHVHGPHGEHHH